MSFFSFFSELRRRRVFRVAAGYAVAGFAVAEAVDLLLPRLGTPDWAVTALIVAVLAGFPLALVMAWSLEVTPEGIRLERAEGKSHEGREPGASSKAGYVLVFLAGVVVSLGVGWWMGIVGGRGGGDDLESVRSLAVLPFSALSDESEDQWMAQGLHDQLITELAHLSGLDRVISRTSVLRYAEAPPAIPEIAQALNVDAVIEGSILPSADRVRINVQLIAGATDDHLWAQDYDRPRAEALDLVKAVAQDIAQEIQLQLNAAEVSRLGADHVVNPAAQMAYFRARALFDERTREDITRAGELFQQAIELDPDWGQAYAGLAIYHALGRAGGDVWRTEEFAERALELDPGLAEAHAALALTALFRDLDWSRAEEHYRTATRIQPGYATAFQWGGELLAGLGRGEEAVAWARRARELDPSSMIIAWNELRILFLARRYEECLAANDHYESDFVDPNYAGNREDCLLGLGRFREVAERMEAPDPVLDEIAANGGEAYWRWIAEETEGMSWIAMAQLGRHDQFFQSFVDILRASGGRLGLNLTYWVSQPLLDPLRRDPRWESVVLRRLGLTQWPG